ncbi:MAG: glycosyltransferase family 4 protein [Candidatus Thorarchaeota archaeon]|jgi:glycosyltransferase involved in cell wall biosynthesis
MDRKRILWISDGVTPTGFSRVAHSVIKNLDSEIFQVMHLAINYWGDPHGNNWMIFPAPIRGNIYGMDRIQEFKSAQVDMIFILNDLWMINEYLREIKKHFDPVPPVVVYFPVDAREFDKRWFEHFDVVTQAVVYTEFGHEVAKLAAPDDMEFEIIPHGVDTEMFYQLMMPKGEIKKIAYPNNPELFEQDSFIVLNANRNQPRKRLDLSLKGFSIFAEGKPNTVRYYHHAGIKDVGWNIPKLAERYGMAERLLLTSLEEGVQKIPENRLNIIYNSTDVGLNTSMGEGWGLPSMEHSITGAPQIVSDNSASREIYKDIGLLIPSTMDQVFERVETEGTVVKPEDVAEQLQKMYDSAELRAELSRKGIEKFSKPEYNWENIAEQWSEIFKRVLKI